MKKFCGNCFAFRKKHIRAKSGHCTVDNEPKQANSYCTHPHVYTPEAELEVPELRS